MSAATKSPPRFDLGGCTVTLVSGGSIKLDGGAMFGVIPKPLWMRGTPADDQNRIQLACNCLLVEWQPDRGRRVIIETGHGSKYGEKEQGIFAIDPTRWILPELHAIGVDPGNITDVVVSHLHFDHAGGLTYERDGRLWPTFPNARLHVQRRELEDARENFGVMTATYRPENFEPLERADRLILLDGAGPVVEGIYARPMPGHTRGHHGIVVSGADRTLVFGGDTIPTAAHLGPAYNMGYDLFPLENRESKRQLLEWVSQRDALLVFDHEPRTPVVRVLPEGQWFRVEPA